MHSNKDRWLLDFTDTCRGCSQDRSASKHPTEHTSQTSTDTLQTSLSPSPALCAHSLPFITLWS